MHLLQAGVDISVIALLLGHESPNYDSPQRRGRPDDEGTRVGQASRTRGQIQRYRAPDSLIDS